MIAFLALLIIGFAIAGIFSLRFLTGKIKAILHPHPVVNFQIKFQVAQLVLTVLVLGLVWFLEPANFGLFFRAGNVSAHISKIAWLGVTGNETWLEMAASLGLFITLGTGLFMFFQVKKAKPDYHLFFFSLLWAIPFSCANAFSEEAIFRIGIVSPLSGALSMPIILLISAGLFGLPHYFGTPSGVIGVLMAGFLGWLLALSVIETQGILLAWAIHCVQDVVIITSMILMSKPSAKPHASPR